MTNPAERMAASTARACMEVVSKGLTQVRGSKSMAACICGTVFYCGWKHNQPHDSDCLVLTCFRAVVNEMPGPWFSFRCDTCKGSGIMPFSGCLCVNCQRVADRWPSNHVPCSSCNGTGRNPIGDA